MWVLRAGKSGKYVDDFIKNNRIYICWYGYEADLSTFTNHESFVQLAEKEVENDTNVAIRNRSSQLEYFCKKMKIGDLILIPKARSVEFVLAKVTGNYEYKATESEFYHSRKVEIIVEEVDSSIFPQNIKYSLGAFRNLFHVRHEAEVCELLKKHYGIDVEV